MYVQVMSKLCQHPQFVCPLDYRRYGLNGTSPLQAHNGLPHSWERYGWFSMGTTVVMAGAMTVRPFLDLDMAEAHHQVSLFT